MANSPAHPSETHTLAWSYPHVLPSRQGASPFERRSTTPAEVSAAQVLRWPGAEMQETVGGDCGVAASGATGSAAVAGG
ncbi:hypothetical protein TBR22_A00970 [Luteitalea sp. TBR-22]|nr:hypothetical protein TBR22_A00970 [Luteitalea sp. TBR-22]